MEEAQALRNRLSIVEAENAQLKAQQVQTDIIDLYERDLLKAQMDAAGVPRTIDVEGQPSASIAVRFAWLIEDYQALKSAHGI